MERYKIIENRKSGLIKLDVQTGECWKLDPRNLNWVRLRMTFESLPKVQYFPGLAKAKPLRKFY